MDVLVLAWTCWCEHGRAGVGVVVCVYTQVYPCGVALSTQLQVWLQQLVKRQPLGLSLLPIIFHHIQRRPLNSLRPLPTCRQPLALSLPLPSLPIPPFPIPPPFIQNLI